MEEYENDNNTESKLYLKENTFIKNPEKENKLMNYIQPTSASIKNMNNVKSENGVNGVENIENGDNEEIERIAKIIDEKEKGCKLINYIEKDNEKDKIFYGCYNCIPRNKNKNEFICKYCYKNCHKECSINLKTYRIVDKDIIKFYCYCALHLNHDIVKSGKKDSIYTQIGKSFYNLNENEIKNTNIKEKIRNLVDVINYYPFSPVENIRFNDSNFNIEKESDFIKKYKDYFQKVLDNKEYEIEKKNKYTNFPLFCYLYFLNKFLLKIKKLSLNDFIQNDISVFKYYKDTYLKKHEEYLKKFINIIEIKKEYESINQKIIEKKEEEKYESMFSYKSQILIKNQFKNVNIKFFLYNIFYYLYYIEFGLSYFLFDPETILEIIKNIHQLTLEIIELKTKEEHQKDVNIFFNTYKKLFILLFGSVQSYFFLKKFNNNENNNSSEKNNNENNDSSEKKEEENKNVVSLALICMIHLIDLMIKDQNKDENQKKKDKNFISQCIYLLNKSFFHSKIYVSNFKSIEKEEEEDKEIKIDKKEKKNEEEINITIKIVEYEKEREKKKKIQF